MAGEFHAKGRGLGVDGVAAADGQRVLVLERAFLQRREQLVDIGQQDVGCLRELDGEGRVEDVGRSQALVHEAGFRPDELAEPGGEGGDVVLGHPLDGVDLCDVGLGIGLERFHRLLAARPDRLGGVLRDHAHLRHGVASMRLDLDPDAEAVLGRPDGGHLRSGIARDHGRVFSPDGPGAPC